MDNIRMYKLSWVEHAESYDGRFICDIYKDTKNELFISGVQVVECVGYVNPELEIFRIQTKHIDRLKQFSVLFEIPETKTITTFYNKRGILEICRYVHKSQTVDFLAWCYDILWAHEVQLSSNT